MVSQMDVVAPTVAEQLREEVNFVKGTNSVITYDLNKLELKVFWVKLGKFLRAIRLPWLKGSHNRCRGRSWASMGMMEYAG